MLKRTSVCRDFADIKMKNRTGWHNAEHLASLTLPKYRLRPYLRAGSAPS